MFYAEIGKVFDTPTNNCSISMKIIREHEEENRKMLYEMFFADQLDFYIYRSRGDIFPWPSTNHGSTAVEEGTVPIYCQALNKYC
jgi:hypothetical protein